MSIRDVSLVPFRVLIISDHHLESSSSYMVVPPPPPPNPRNSGCYFETQQLYIFCFPPRFFSFGFIFVMFSVTPEDIIYCALPPYHAGGGAMGIGACLVRGNTVALRRKFSASRFWDDCVETKATVRKLSCNTKSVTLASQTTFLKILN